MGETGSIWEGFVKGARSKEAKSMIKRVFLVIMQSKNVHFRGFR